MNLLKICARSEQRITDIREEENANLNFVMIGT